MSVLLWLIATGLILVSLWMLAHCSDATLYDDRPGYPDGEE